MGLEVLLVRSDRRRVRALVDREAPDLNVFKFEDDPRRVKNLLRRGRGCSESEEGGGEAMMLDSDASRRPVRDL